MMNHTKLTILQINDTHGYLEPHPELFRQGGKAEYRRLGGYHRILQSHPAASFDQVRKTRSGRFPARIMKTFRQSMAGWTVRGRAGHGQRSDSILRRQEHHLCRPSIRIQGPAVTLMEEA